MTDPTQAELEAAADMLMADRSQALALIAFCVLQHKTIERQAELLALAKMVLDAQIAAKTYTIRCEQSPAPSSPSAMVLPFSLFTPN